MAAQQQQQPPGSDAATEPLLMEQFDGPAMDAQLRWLHAPASSTLGPGGLTVQTHGETGKQHC